MDDRKIIGCTSAPRVGLLTSKQMDDVTDPDYGGPFSRHLQSDRALLHSPSINVFDVIAPAHANAESRQFLILGQLVDRRRMDAQIIRNLFDRQNIHSSHHFKKHPILMIDLELAPPASRRQLLLATGSL
jgi:hypothetical protein